MKTREDILGALRQLKPLLTEQYGLRRLALFGSFARGDQTDASDVDVLVDVDPAIGLDFVVLADRIESVIGVPTEVVSRRAVKPRAWEIIEPELVDV